jgi:hypothetical protein
MSDLTSTDWARSVATYAKQIAADMKDYPRQDLALDAFVMSVDERLKTLQLAWGNFLAKRDEEKRR